VVIAEAAGAAMVDEAGTAQRRARMNEEQDKRDE
jgi:hypothetical protein